MEPKELVLEEEDSLRNLGVSLRKDSDCLSIGQEPVAKKMAPPSLAAEKGFGRIEEGGKS